MSVTLALAGTDLVPSERQHGDDFLLLAAHELVDVFDHTGAAAARTVAQCGWVAPLRC